MNFGYHLDFGYVIQHVPDFAHGLAWTLILLIVTASIGTALGIAGGAVRAYRLGGWLAFAVGGVVEFVRSTPLYAQIFFLFFGLPELGLNLPTFAVGALALATSNTAYNIENFRAALLSQPIGYREAAQSLGLKPWACFRLITLPLALRQALPSIANTTIDTLKNSALMIAISFPELMTTSLDLVAVSFRVFEVFSVIAVLYLALSWVISRAFLTLESHLRVVQR